MNTTVSATTIPKNEKPSSKKKMSENKLLHQEDDEINNNNKNSDSNTAGGIYNDVINNNKNASTSSSSKPNTNTNEEPQFTPDELRRARSSMITLAIGGLLVGYDIGIVGVILAFYKAVMSIPCTAASSASVCEWLSGTDDDDACMWVPHRKSCITNGIGQLCLANGFVNASSCNNVTQVWNPRASQVQNISCRWQSQYSAVTDPVRYMNFGHCLDDAPAQKASLYSSTEAGLVTVMLIVAGFIGSWFSRRYVATPLKTVKALQWVGVISAISCIFLVGTWFVTSFSGRLAMLLIARFIAGIVLGSVSVFCVLFNALNSPPALVSPVGVYFQVFLTLGIFLAALFAYLVRYSLVSSSSLNGDNNNSNNNSDHHQSATQFFADGNDSVGTETIQKFQFVFGMNFAASILLIALPYFVTVKGTHLDYFDGDGASSRSSFAGEEPQENKPLTTGNNNNNNHDAGEVVVVENNNQDHQEQEQEQNEEDEDNEDPASPGSTDTWKSWKEFFSRPHLVIAGTLLALIQQFSSINAIMFYLPKIAASEGVSDVFLSNMVIMAWNFVTAIAAIPIAKIGKQRFGLESADIYTPGAFFGAICCFIIGIGSYPGVASAEVHSGLSIFGLAMFLLVFEVSMGPHWYTLSQSIFPEDVRKTACVWTNSIHFGFTALVSFGFPLVIEGFGGGGGNQTSEQEQKGIASAFIMFGCINIVSVVILKLLLPRLLLKK